MHVCIRISNIYIYIEREEHIPCFGESDSTGDLCGSMFSIELNGQKYSSVWFHPAAIIALLCRVLTTGGVRPIGNRTLASEQAIRIAIPDAVDSWKDSNRLQIGLTSVKSYISLGRPQLLNVAEAV